ncbi:MAG: radical SAM family heme chaperone HemW [Ignavibacteriales bacterium]|nr:radical SAM family heme chaperone HemW [Ignavibacteriales bacterium]
MSSLYLHIPFCEHKCIYCDFYSIAPREAHQEEVPIVDRFLRSLEREISLQAEHKEFKTDYETVFFGGGTPSLLSPIQIQSILSCVRSRFDLRANAEVTLETNPGTVDAAKLEGFREAGVNRLSVGIQSFHDDDLKFLTRIHSSEQARRTLRDAFEAGFVNVSLDLIFALPGQTLERWKSNLAQAIALQPTHISCYSLIIEPNTPLKRMVETRQAAMLSPELDAEMYDAAIEFLARNGYEQYEVSNFAKPGFRSRHNGNYWNHANYLSFGPSAHSFWNGRRWWNVANLVNYCERVEAGRLPVAGEERLGARELAEEFIFLGLRGEGLDLQRLKREYAVDLRSEYVSTLRHLADDGLASIENEKLCLTPKGYALCDEICASFR